MMWQDVIFYFKTVPSKKIDEIMGAQKVKALNHRHGRLRLKL